MLEETGAEQRLAVYFKGAVQGVGFRYTALRVAKRFAVVGFVRNLADGRVEVVAEGSGEEVHRFIEAIRAEMGGCVTDIEQKAGPAEGRFHGFEIRF